MLVTLGDTPEGSLLVNIEHFSTLGLHGPDQHVRDTLTGIVVLLGTASWADTTQILVCDAPVDVDLAGIDNTHAREHVMRIDRTWPWRHELANAYTRLRHALP